MSHVSLTIHQTKALEVVFKNILFPQEFEGYQNSSGSDPLQEKQFETAN
jgi:hypothetical protein